MIVASRTTTDIAKMSFEAALAELREIVEALEKGEGRLDEAISSYERGAALKKHCEAKLSEAQQKIEKISHGSTGTIGTENFEIE